MTDHPITPPPELVEQWYEASVLEGRVTYDEFNFANLAARWGADQELEACCEWLPEQTPWDTDKLRAARRPKPPLLKEQALHALLHIDQGQHNERCHIIRRALEQLDD